MVRDDLLKRGTKQRAIIPLLQKLIAEEDKSLNVKPKYLHPFSALTASFGADVRVTSSLTEAELEQQIRIQWKIICLNYGRLPGTVWLPLGSGTLTKVFLKVLPISVSIKCVDVGVLTPTDSRISDLKNHPRIQYFTTREAYHERSKRLPPIPSNLHYDAKLWDIIFLHGKDGDLWWNVAR